MNLKIKNKIKLNKQEGSALILAILVLVSALIMVTAIVSISVTQRKMSGKTKNTAAAYQLADSGLEWALKNVRNASGNEEIESVFVNDSIDPSTGALSCGLALSTTETAVFNPECEVYFYEKNKDAGNVKTLITENKNLNKVVYIKAVGYYGAESDRAMRAVEAPVSLANLPIVRWEFENDFTDSTGNGFNASENGGATFMSDTVAGSDSNYSLSFDGVDDYLDLSNTFPSNSEIETLWGWNNFSLSFWIKPGNITIEDRGIIGEYVDSGICGLIYIENTIEKLVFRLNDGSGLNDLVATVPLEEGKWMHVVISKDNNGKATFFIDGNKAGEKPSMPLSINQPVEFFGKTGIVSSSPFSINLPGSLDDIQIFGFAIDESQAKRIYELGPR